MGSVIPLLLVVVVFVLLIIVPYRRQAQRQRDVRSMQAALQPGTDVMTTSGMYGTVVSIGDTAAELEIAPGLVIRVARAAIGEVVKPSAPALEGEYAEASEDADEYEDEDSEEYEDGEEEEYEDGEYEEDAEDDETDTEYEDDETDGDTEEGPQDGTAPRKDGGSS